MDVHENITRIRDIAAAHSWRADRDSWTWYCMEHNTPDMRYTPDTKVWGFTFKEYAANRYMSVYVTFEGVVVWAAWRQSGSFAYGDWQPISGGVEGVVAALMEFGRPRWVPVPYVQDLDDPDMPPF